MWIQRAFLVFFLAFSCAEEWTDVDVDDPIVKEILPKTVEYINDETWGNRYHIVLEKVLNATKRAGDESGTVVYRLDLNFSSTICPKTKIPYDLVEDSCEVDENGIYYNCKRVDVIYSPEESFLRVSGYSCQGTRRHARKSSTLQRFDDFLKRHGKHYVGEEFGKRLNIFRDNLKTISYLNANERGTARYGLTEFADLTAEEFRQYRLGFKPELQNDYSPIAETPSGPIPESFDWRTQKAVTEVKNQGQCGSCWAFSTTGNIEGQWAIKKKQLVSLSEQELVDCDKLDQGCNGGLPSNAYKEIIRVGGLTGESNYPYTGVDGTCSFKPAESKVYINSSISISKNETEMAAWLAKNGPISIGINALPMQFYFGGISHPWKIFCNPANLDHGVLIVGYGVEKSTPYWIIKNSWGASWGESGYYRIYRGDGSCGLNTMATSAVIN